MLVVPRPVPQLPAVLERTIPWRTAMAHSFLEAENPEPDACWTSVWSRLLGSASRISPATIAYAESHAREAVRPPPGTDLTRAYGRTAGRRGARPAALSMGAAEVHRAAPGSTQPAMTFSATNRL